eukprot:gene20112-26838_t
MAEGRLSHADSRARESEAECGSLRDQLATTLDNLRGLSGEHEAVREELRAVTEDLEALVKENQVVSNELAVVTQHRDASADELRRTSAKLSSTEQMSVCNKLAVMTQQRDASEDALRRTSAKLSSTEQMSVCNKLAVMTQQRDASEDALRRTSAKVSSTEKMVRAKEIEVEDLRRAYEALALESRRFQSTVAQLEREAALREASLKNRSEEASSLADANRDGQSQINQYVQDLQAFERQVDSLSRQLAKAENDSEEMVREREVLLEEIRSAQQVRLGLERHREDLQRQVASLDSQLAITRARLEDAGSESSSLGQRLAIERNRVAELEGLLAGMRAREYKSDLSSTKSGSQLALWQERNRILEEQVATMQHQVQALQKGRDAQDRELARLRNEALSLAASAATLEQQSHSAVAKMAVQTSSLELGAKDQALALRSLREERDAFASQLDNVSRQLEASLEHGTPSEGLHARMGELERAVLELRAENDRLVRLAGSMESERGVAQKEAASLRRQLSGGASGTGGAAKGALEDATRQVVRLQTMLKSEQAKRRQAERDFLELMESIEQQASPGEGGSAGALATRRMGEMQVRIDALEAEKLSLEDSIQKMHSLMLGMQEELHVIHNEYGVAGDVLQTLSSALAQQPPAAAVCTPQRRT